MRTDDWQVSTDPGPAAVIDRAEAAEDAGDPGEELSVVDHVVIRLGGGRYAVRAPDVAEVTRVPAVTRLPWSPVWLLGIGNWRGHVLSLVDLRPLLGLSDALLPSSARVVVVAVDGIEVGLLAEVVTGLAAVPERIPAPPHDIAPDAATLLRGLADGGPGGPVGVLDTAALLALRHRVPQSRAGAGAV